MNAREAIQKRAEKHGWIRIVGDKDSEIWARNGERIAIHYKMFGTPCNYMLRYYGKDPSLGINWGVETAAHGDELITGKNKKKQILERLSSAA